MFRELLNSGALPFKGKCVRTFYLLKEIITLGRTKVERAFCVFFSLHRKNPTLLMSSYLDGSEYFLKCVCQIIPCLETFKS